MIVFEFTDETHVDGIQYSRILYWIGTTDVVGSDRAHKCEIYEQLDAVTCGLA
jgi:hypothetical protein